MRLVTNPPLPAGVPDDRAVALLIRHAERPAIPEGSMGMDLALTEGGQAAARELGSRLGASIHRVHCSAIHRCVQTARAIIAGAGLSLQPVVDATLGVPSTFALASPEAERTVRELGFERLMEHLIRGESALPGLPHPAEGARMLREHALSFLDGAPGFHLLVTHDAMIAAMVARSTTDPFGPEAWPGFLESAALWRENGRPMLAYRERVSELRG
jgi:broad specificity phosphatase PhoE